MSVVKLVPGKLKSLSLNSEVKIKGRGLYICRGAVLCFSQPNEINDDYYSSTYIGRAGEGEVLLTGDIASNALVTVISLADVNYIEFDDSNDNKLNDLISIAQKNVMELITNSAHRHVESLQTLQSHSKENRFCFALKNLVSLSNSINITYNYSLPRAQLFAMANLKRSNGFRLFSDFEKKNIIANVVGKRAFSINVEALNGYWS